LTQLAERIDGGYHPPGVQSLDLDHHVLVAGGLVVDAAALLQGFAFYHHGCAGRRKRSDENGRCDNTPASQADIPCRTRLVDAGVVNADSWRSDTDPGSANIAGGARLIDAWIADADSWRSDPGSSAPYADLVYASITRLQRDGQCCQ